MIRASPVAESTRPELKDTSWIAMISRLTLLSMLIYGETGDLRVSHTIGDYCRCKHPSALAESRRCAAPQPWPTEDREQTQSRLQTGQKASAKSAGTLERWSRLLGGPRGQSWTFQANPRSTFLPVSSSAPFNCSKCLMKRRRGFIFGFHNF